MAFCTKTYNFLVKPVFYQWEMIFLDLSLTSIKGISKCIPPINKLLEETFRSESMNKIVSFANMEFNLEDSDNFHGKFKDRTSWFKLERKISVVNAKIKLPLNWKPFQSHTCCSFTLEKTSAEYKKIAKTFYLSMDAYLITEIIRFQNLLVYQKYYGNISRCLNSQNVVEHEHFLFHGTRNVPARNVAISQEGFDVRLANDQCLFGPAAYFAEDASYSDKFAYENNGVKEIIVASVLTGDTFNYGTMSNPSLKQPPINIDTNKRYHSITAMVNGSRIYAVFNSHQSCPRYIVKYSKK